MANTKNAGCSSVRDACRVLSIPSTPSTAHDTMAHESPMPTSKLESSTLEQHLLTSVVNLIYEFAPYHFCYLVSCAETLTLDSQQDLISGTIPLRSNDSKPRAEYDYRC